MKGILFSGRVSFCAILTIFIILFVLPGVTRAGDKQLIGETGWWDAADNWNPSGQPQNGDDVFLIQTDAIDRDVHYRNTLSPEPTLTTLNISATGTGNIALNLGQDTLEVDDEYIGYSSSPSDPYASGTVNQTGGEHIVHGNLTLGTFGTGTYIMLGGNLTANRIELGDAGGKGVFNQSGGTVEAGSLILAAELEYGNEGVYDLSDGSLTTSYTSVGDWHEGYFNQSGGTHETELLRVGFEGDGWYNLSGGRLVAEKLEVAIDYPYTGTITQTGGVHIVDDEFHLGSIDGSGYGVYDLIAGTLETGSASIGSGTFTQAGGIHEVADTLLIEGGRNNSYNNLGGTLTASTCINDGAYISSESEQYFENLNTGEVGYLSSRYADEYHIADDFLSSSEMNAEWKTSYANLNFTEGDNGNHEFYLTGIDYGVATGGYNDNFAWKTLRIEADNFIDLYDGNDERCGALYVKELIGAEIIGDQITNIYNNDCFNMYYKANLPANEYLGGRTYDLSGGGQLIPIFESVINEILNFLEESEEEGTIFGRGRGRSADRRFTRLWNMAVRAGKMIDNGRLWNACWKLKQIIRRCDGSRFPRDYVGGPAAPELVDMIYDLRHDLNCR